MRHASTGADAPVLEVVRESKVLDLVARLGPGTHRLEASGVVAAGGALWVVFDDTAMIARLDPALRPGLAGNRVVHPPGGRDNEDIAHDETDGSFFVLVESVRVPDGRYLGAVREYDASFALLRTRLVDHVVAGPNKGLEGLTCVRREGIRYLLAMCEGNNCSQGSAGRRPGGGRVHVLVDGGEQWRVVETLDLPSDLAFADYSGLSVTGDLIAVVSQESSALWVGRLAADRWAVVDGSGTTYLFPRTDRDRIRYGTVEGVSWLDDHTLAVVSDRAKRNQPDRVRATDQSVHIVVLPEVPTVRTLPPTRTAVAAAQ